jgi:hypothetical protein
MKMKTLSILTLMGAMLAFTACEEPDYPDSIFNPDDPGKPTPVIAAVNPPDEAYGAIAQKKTVEITGQNFAASVEENLVYFGSSLATVLEASPTRLVVEPPANFSDSLRLRIDARGAFLFGDYKNADGSWHYYTLLNPVSKPGSYNSEDANATSLITMDASGNLYMIRGKTVDMVTPDGVRSTIGEVLTPNALGNARGGNFGELYYTFTKYFIKTVIDTAAGTSTHERQNIGVNLRDLDFDSEKATWLVGEKTILRANPDEIVAETVYENENIIFMKVRYFQNALYMVGEEKQEDGSKLVKIYRLPIDPAAGTAAGSLEVLGNWSATEYGQKSITVLEMNAQGKMYIGTKSLPLMSFDPATGLGETLYPKILSRYIATRMIFGNDDHIYINTFADSGSDYWTILKVRIFENGAPYHRRG